MLAPGVREAVVTAGKKHGFQYVTLDLGGYRTGSHNEVFVGACAAHRLTSNVHRSFPKALCDEIPAHDGARRETWKRPLAFYVNALGLRELRRSENEKGRFTLVFLAAPGDDSAQIELTYNWIQRRSRAGATSVTSPIASKNIYETCQRLLDAGVVINRPPRDGHMAFVRSPDNISIELLQAGPALPPAEPGRPCPTRANGEQRHLAQVASGLGLAQGRREAARGDLSGVHENGEEPCCTSEAPRGEDSNVHTQYSLRAAEIIEVDSTRGLRAARAGGVRASRIRASRAAPPQGRSTLQPAPARTTFCTVSKCAWVTSLPNVFSIRAMNTGPLSLRT